MSLITILERKKTFGLILFLVLIVYLVVIIWGIPSPAPQCHHSGPREWSTEGTREFKIRNTWNGQCIDHPPASISLSPALNGDVTLKVFAHFFNSPPKPPNAVAGQPYPELWNYEVAEAFFLNDNNQYVEVELSPHGVHLVLLLNGVRNAVKELLPMTYNATISADNWWGEATIPRAYFPPGVTKFNAYAIFNEGEARQYEALYPFNNAGPKDQPDFHRLETFQPIDMSKVMNNFSPQEVSDTWKSIIQ